MESLRKGKGFEDNSDRFNTSESKSILLLENDYPADVLSVIIGHNRNQLELLFRTPQELAEERKTLEEAESESEGPGQWTTQNVVIETYESNDIWQESTKDDGSEGSEQESENDFRGFSPIMDFIQYPICTRTSYDETCRRNDLFMPARPSHTVIGSYGIGAHEKIILKKYCSFFGFEYTNSFTKAVSILIFKGISPVNNSSFKYLMALAARAKIVNFEWVLHSIRENKALPEKDYLLRDLSLEPDSQDFSHNIFFGMNVIPELLHGLYEPEAIEHLFCLMGANVIPSIMELHRHRYLKNKILLFFDEHQLDANILNTCAKYSTLAVNFNWVQDSLRHGRKLPVVNYLSFTFPLSEETLALYGIDPGEDHI